MAATKSRKKTPVKTTRKKAGVKKKKGSLDEVETSMEAMALTDFTDSTRDELKKLGDRIHEAADRGVHIVKDIAEEVHRYAKDATERTRIKIELHNLKAERDKLYTLMGEQIRNLYKSKKLTNINRRFKADFKKLDDLEKAINEHEKKAAELST